MMFPVDQLRRLNAGFSSWQEYEIFLELLQDLAKSEAIKEIAPSSARTHAFERWFVEIASGRVFQLVEPDPPARGFWSEIHLQEHDV